MIRKIRQNVFETNSSSTHSVTWSGDDYRMDPKFIELNEDGYIIMYLEGFCSTCHYTTAVEKMGYLAQLCAYNNHIYLNHCAGSTQLTEALGELYACEEFLDLQQTIVDYVGGDCKGIRFSENSSYGYIDDGWECGSVTDFLEENGLSVTSFVFGDADLYYSYNG